MIVRSQPESKNTDPGPAAMIAAKKVWSFIRREHGDWNLPKPKLILSVTGGAKKFYMKARHLTSFKQGLMKAATSAG